MAYDYGTLFKNALRRRIVFGLLVRFEVPQRVFRPAATLADGIKDVGNAGVVRRFHLGNVQEVQIELVDKILQDGKRLHVGGIFFAAIEVTFEIIGMQALAGRRSNGTDARIVLGFELL